MTPLQNLIDFKERVREANPLIDVVQEAGVRLRKSGKNWVGLCPFHQETKSSFTIFHDGQRYHCFGCGEKGDVFKFIEKVNGFDFKEAFQSLADRANLTIPQQVQRETKDFQEAMQWGLYDDVLKQIEKGETLKTNKEKDLLVQMLIPDIAKLDPLRQQRLGEVLEKKFKISRTTFSRMLKKTEEATPTVGQVETRTLIPGEVHLIQDGKVKYLLKKAEKLEVRSQITLDSKSYAPKQDLPFKLMGPKILKMKREDGPVILEKMIAFIKRYLEMPREHDYLILALWTAHTYLIEKFNTTPILYFHGVYETGKTRGGEVLEEIAFRAERLTSPTEAGMFRAAHLFKTSLIIDEVKLWGQDGNPEVARLIKSRYKRGQKVLRVNLNLKGQEEQLEYFDVFGPLVLCTKETIDPDIQNRCILFVMRENSDPKVEEDIDEAQAEWLRNQLTLLRAEWLDGELPKVERIARRRLNEILQPLHRTLMVLDPSKEKQLKSVAQGLQKMGRDESSETLEAEIVKAIWDDFQKNDEPVFATKDIVERVNQDRADKHKLSSHLVTKCIKRLGYEIYRTSQFRGFKLDIELLDRHYEQYGL